MRPNLETQGVILNQADVEWAEVAQQLVCAEMSDKLPAQFSGKELSLPLTNGESAIDVSMTHKVHAVATLALKQTSERLFESGVRYKKALAHHADDFTLMSFRMEMTYHEESKTAFKGLIDAISIGLDQSESSLISKGLGGRASNA